MDDFYANISKKLRFRLCFRNFAYFSFALFLIFFIAWRLCSGSLGLLILDRKIETNLQKNFSQFNVSVPSSSLEKGNFVASDFDILNLNNLKIDYPQYSEQIDFFVENIDNYSKNAVNTLLLSPEKVDFVLLEPYCNSYKSSSNIHLNLIKGEIPYFIQYDSRWAFYPYGSGKMGYTACGPTCLSMVVMGLSGNENYTPQYMADFSYINGFYVDGVGTAWSLFDRGVEAFNLSSEILPINEKSMKNVLDQGGAIIASLSNGDFTINGHMIVIDGYGEKGFTVLDPSSLERSRHYWPFSVLSTQIDALWGIEAKDF